MDMAGARDAVATAIDTLGVSGTLDVLITHLNANLEALTLSKDKPALHRAASDHRLLVQTRDKLYN